MYLVPSLIDTTLNSKCHEVFIGFVVCGRRTENSGLLNPEGSGTRIFIKKLALLMIHLKDRVPFGAVVLPITEGTVDARFRYN